MQKFQLYNTSGISLNGIDSPILLSKISTFPVSRFGVSVGWFFGLLVSLVWFDFISYCWRGEMKRVLV